MHGCMDSGLRYTIMLHPAAVRPRYPGRAILFDAGTNKYASSLGYLIPAYAEVGIQFDAVYA